ncbi:hypothetical protein, partial [Metamycoplasma hominis]
QLDQEIQKASQVVASNDTKAINSSKTSLDAKITDITKKLEALNKEYADSVKKSDELSKLLSKENDNSPASQEAAARHIL